MRTVWCLLLVIVCLLKYSHSFLSNDSGILQELRTFKIANETDSELCQNVLRHVISTLTNSEAIVEVLREKGKYANEWIFGENANNGKNWCMDKKSPVVYISWNQETCMNLRVFDKTGKWNIRKHICEEYTNHTSINEKSEITKLRHKRESGTEITYGFVNIAKEWKRKSCSRPLLEIYLNEQLIFLNQTDVGKAAQENAQTEQIKVHINANLTGHQPKPKKKYTFVHKPVPFTTAKQDCFEKGMNLLSVKNADENKDIVEAMKNEASDIYWTSGNKLVNHVTWRWSDSQKFEYFSWTNGEPNNAQGDEYCVEIWRTGEWNDNVCAVELPYICEALEIPKDVVMPTVEIFVDEDLVFDNSSKSGSDVNQTPTVSVHIGLDGNNNSDHSTIVLFKMKDPSKDSVQELKNLVIPKGFIPDTFNGIDFTVELLMEKDFRCPKIYKIPPKLWLTHSEALEFCQKNLSMKLVSIQDEEEHLVVEKMAKEENIDNYYWTSGYLYDKVWYWNENEKIVYTKWETEKPDKIGGTENCIEMYFPYYKAEWNDQDCGDKNRVICESSD